MKIALFYYGDPLNQGGTGYVLDCLYRSFEKANHRLYFFNPFYKGRYVHKLIKLKIHNYTNLFTIIRNKTKFKVLFKSIMKILLDKRVNLSDRLKILLFLLIKPNILINTIDNLAHIYHVMKNLDVDIILGGATSGYELPLIFLISRILNKKLCSLTYGNDFLVKSKYSLQSYYIRNLDLIFFGANTIKDLCKRIHPTKDNQLKVIRYGLIFEDYKVKESKEELRSVYRIPKNKFVLLSVGRHVSRKNFDNVIKAIKNIKEKDPNADILYYLIGEGETTQRLKELTIQFGLSNEIKFLGYTSKEVRNKFYKLSDLFLMPSSKEPESIEGFGIVFIEANYFKCPVIGTFSGGISEAIVDGETGFLVREKNVDDLVEKILFMYNNRDLCRAMGLKGFERVLKDFNWNNIVDEYFKAFNQILD